MTPAYAEIRDAEPRRAFRWRSALAAAASGLVLASCAWIEGPETVPVAAPLPPSVPRVSVARPASNAQDREIVSRFGGIYRAPAAEAMVNDIVARLVAASDMPGARYDVSILDTPMVNAFAVPNGRIYVTRGLLALANDGAELAAVLAHEIAHVVARHADARVERQRRDDLVSRVSEDVLKDPAAAENIRSASRRTLSQFSQSQELEADHLGIRMVAKAGFDPYGAVRFLTALGRNAHFRAGGDGNHKELLASHPATPDRITKALHAARQITSPGAGARDRERYLRAIDGIAFGDNPANGAVRGRRFVHPKLQIGFTAPEGFQLDTSTDAVIGANADASQALRFDAVKLPVGQSPAEYLEKGLLQEGTLTNIEPLPIAGLPGAVGLARGADWTYRVGVVKIEEATYRFIYASRSNTPDIDRQFRAVLASFRRLDGEEVARARPTRLEVVFARHGETAEQLAGRMQGVVNRPVEQFRILNGLEGNAGVAAGQPYKVIAE
jgi:predicted Zn-dependent protease